MSSETSPLPPSTAAAPPWADASHLPSEESSGVPGNRDSAIRAVILEYGWMGWSPEQIASLFHDPYYPLLNHCWHDLGDTGVRELVATTLRHSGLVRVQPR